MDKSQGLDGIYPRLLKKCNSCLSKPLSIIYQKSVDTGILLTDFKRANITPIFKKGCHNSTGYYRPVSITSLPCKPLESIIRDEMLGHLESIKCFQMIDMIN